MTYDKQCIQLHPGDDFTHVEYSVV